MSYGLFHEATPDIISRKTLGYPQGKIIGKVNKLRPPGAAIRAGWFLLMEF